MVGANVESGIETVESGIETVEQKAARLSANLKDQEKHVLRTVIRYMGPGLNLNTVRRDHYGYGEKVARSLEQKGFFSITQEGTIMIDAQLLNAIPKGIL